MCCRKMGLESDFEASKGVNVALSHLDDRGKRRGANRRPSVGMKKKWKGFEEAVLRVMKSKRGLVRGVWSGWLVRYTSVE